MYKITINLTNPFYIDRLIVVRLIKNIYNKITEVYLEEETL